jgi:hypothetical protein
VETAHITKNNLSKLSHHIIHYFKGTVRRGNKNIKRNIRAPGDGG